MVHMRYAIPDTKTLLVEKRTADLSRLHRPKLLAEPGRAKRMGKIPYMAYLQSISDLRDKIKIVFDGCQVTINKFRGDAGDAL